MNYTYVYNKIRAIHQTTDIREYQARVSQINPKNNPRHIEYTHKDID